MSGPPYPRAAVVVLVALAVTAAPGRADDQLPDDRDAEPVHVTTALVEAAIALAIPGTYYWATQQQQEVDWTLRWDWDSWEAKLTGKALHFDTNPFHVNAVRHPLTGVIDYHIARTNGFGMLGSTLFAYATGAVWEFFIEFREDPAINDLILNGAAGLGIGEPLYQLGQLWRGGVLSPADRVRTALFSPVDAMHDLIRPSHRWWRERAWRLFELGGGVASRRLDDSSARPELALMADFEVINHAPFVTPGPHAGPTRPGAWSAIRGGIRFGDVGDGHQVTGTLLRSRTSLFGRYGQDARGNGLFAGLGAGFFYRRDRLPVDWDRIAIAHLVGPQLQVTRRAPELMLQWDLAAYADFGLVQAYAFGHVRPFPAPPPYESPLQAEGYYDAGGATVSSRLRVNAGHWHLDLEGDGIGAWQLDFAERGGRGSGSSSSTISSGATATTTSVIARPHGASDLRFYGHAALGFRQGRWMIAATADTAFRRGSWRTFARQGTELAVGARLSVDL